MGEASNSGKWLRLLGAVLVLAAIYWAVQWAMTRPGRMSFEDVADLPGFRRMQTGAVSRPAFDPLAGIDGPQIVPAPDDQLCDWLFDADAGRGVPVAYFTDFFCTNCRIMEGRLEAAADEGVISVTRHDWPILGDASEMAARAYLAAEALGAGPQVRARLNRAVFVPEESYLARLAESVGLDPGSLFDAMESPDVEAALARSRALAARFGFYATPSMVIGNTIVVGAVDERILVEVIAEEEGTVCAVP